ncbi:MAG: DNA (cytosine-5-)-methyltransferase [Actinobacteria bacterium]|nr:DNA (cytosine-5-)-methyltransferase [Actinomycetota bacterium]
MKVASFFAGIGGFDLGLERAGMEVVFQCEINPFCQRVLNTRWPDVPLHDDISTLSAKSIPKADIWTGGFPCQDVSLANQGKRKGLQGARSGLFYTFAELVEARRPPWIILENVPGLLNSHGGEDFRTVIERLDELGYGVSWRVLDAKYFGTPQRRRRVYIVASRGSLRSAEVLFEPGANHEVARAGLGQRDLSTRRNAASLRDSGLYSIQHATIGRGPKAGPQAKGYRNDGETYTLDSRGSSDVVCSTDAPFRVRETARVSRELDSNRFRAVGNAVCVPIIEWLGTRIVSLSQP